ncbi:MAG TPA: preprotein translocase subunit YajC [Candidatus Binataceae bacterium]|nr:preprotein translocase subunit YajC [Candidatus Binataceae bacterium]
MSFEGIAYAQTDKTAGASQQVIFTTVIPLVFLFAIFYFLLIRPQAKKASDLQKMLAALKRNDEVVTTGGLLGRVVELGDRVVVLEIAPNVRVRVERAQISSLSAYSKAAGKAGS